MATTENQAGEPGTRYLREQDLGHTVLGDVGEVTKDDVRVAAFEDCEAANSMIGITLAFGNFDVEVARTLTSMQNDLFDLAADLSAPFDEELHPEPVRITEAHVAWVERAREHYSSELNQVDGFVLPGGTVSASLLYQARMATRRAERSLVRAMKQHPTSINPLTARYLDCIGHLLFALARKHNAELGDSMWHPLASVTVQEPTQR